VPASPDVSRGSEAGPATEEARPEKAKPEGGKPPGSGRKA
jgi:hypothetical protein